jgi:hypothetical protein
MFDVLTRVHEVSEAFLQSIDGIESGLHLNLKQNYVVVGMRQRIATELDVTVLHYHIPVHQMVII